MNIEKFKIHLIELLQNSLENKAAVSIRMENLSGTPEDTLNINLLKENRIFSIPVNSLYKVYQHEKDISVVVDMVLSSILSSVSLNKSNIIYGLVNVSEQEILLKNVPHIPFYDMAIIFNYVTFTNIGKTFLTVTHDFMEEHQLTLHELDELAKKNTFRLFPCAATPTIYDTFRALMEDPKSDMGDFLQFAATAFVSRQKPMLLTATCENYKNGSVALLNTKFLSEIAEKLEQNILLLPVSDQVFVIMPYTGEFDKNFIHEFTKDCLKVGDSPILTHNIFIFHKATKRLGLFV